MTGNPAASQARPPSFLSWSRRGEDYYLAIVIAVSLAYCLLMGKSNLAMAAFLAAVICHSLLDTAIRKRNLRQVNQFKVWVIRVGAAIAGYWLFSAVHAVAPGIFAVTLFAAAYVACEWLLWRSVREFRAAQAA